VARALNHVLKRPPLFKRFLDDGRICLSNNAAERARRGAALDPETGLFGGSERGGQRAAAMHSPIVTAKIDDVDPHTRLADIRGRIAEHPVHQIEELQR
jgi:hypothetical protein